MAGRGGDIQVSSEISAASFKPIRSGGLPQARWFFFSSSIKSIDWRGGGDFKVSSEISAASFNQLVAVVFLKRDFFSSIVPLKALIGGEGGDFKVSSEISAASFKPIGSGGLPQAGGGFFSSSIESIDWRGGGGILKFLQKSQQHPSNQLVAVVFLKRGFFSSIVPLKALIGGEGGILKFFQKSQQHPSNQLVAVVFPNRGRFLQ